MGNRSSKICLWIFVIFHRYHIYIYIGTDLGHHWAALHLFGKQSIGSGVLYWCVSISPRWPAKNNNRKIFWKRKKEQSNLFVRLYNFQLLMFYFHLKIFRIIGEPIDRTFDSNIYLWRFLCSSLKFINRAAAKALDQFFPVALLLSPTVPAKNRSKKARSITFLLNFGLLLLHFIHKSIKFIGKPINSLVLKVEFMDFSCFTVTISIEFEISGTFSHFCILRSREL